MLHQPARPSVSVSARLSRSLISINASLRHQSNVVVVEEHVETSEDVDEVTEPEEAVATSNVVMEVVAKAAVRDVVDEEAQEGNTVESTVDLLAVAHVVQLLVLPSRLTIPVLSQALDRRIPINQSLQIILAGFRIVLTKCFHRSTIEQNLCACKGVRMLRGWVI